MWTKEQQEGYINPLSIQSKTSPPWHDLYSLYKGTPGDMILHIFFFVGKSLQIETLTYFKSVMYESQQKPL